MDKPQPKQKFPLWIIVCGNPVDGFEFIGPFEQSHDAIEYGNNDGNLDSDWWTAELQPAEQPDVPE